MSDHAQEMTNGRGAAAVLSAGIGSLALALLALAGDASRSISTMLNFWRPTGPLSGVTDIAILIWLATWLALSQRWARRDVNLARINTASFVMLAAAILITFPPIMDFLQGDNLNRLLCRTSVIASVLLAASFSASYAGPPFITDDPEPVDLGHWEVYGFSAGASGHGDTTGLGPSIEVNYGAAPGLQLHIIGGLSYDDLPGGQLSMGLSDTELGTKIRLINPGEDDWYPQVGVFPLVEAPTGDALRGLGAGQWAEFLPIWLQKDWGKWTTYGGGGYWINPGPGNRNYCLPNLDFD